MCLCLACLQALAHSPQFHQQLATLGGALQTGQLDLAQFGLQAEVRKVIQTQTKVATNGVQHASACTGISIWASAMYDDQVL
jgi:hypothetical protein